MSWCHLRLRRSILLKKAGSPTFIILWRSILGTNAWFITLTMIFLVLRNDYHRIMLMMWHVWKLCSFRYEIRTSVRAKVLSVLSSLLTSYGHWYEVRCTNLPLQGFLHNTTCHDTSRPFPLDDRVSMKPKGWKEWNGLLKEDFFNNSISEWFLL